jgi:hypothetical protein
MAQGGKRPGAGRPRGARNVKTVEQAEAAVAGGLTPLEYMLSVMRDEGNDKATRLDAANKAAPYVHAKLASVDHKSSDGTMTPQPARVEIVAVDGDGTG